MKYEMSYAELANQKVGAAITLTAVMAVIAVAVAAIVAYKIFLSKKGTTTIPGGWKFTWN
jgi:hypothetical protein